MTIQFELHYFEGCTCTGCAVIEDLFIHVPFSQAEVDLMHQLVSSISDDDADYSQGILPILREAAPHLHERISSAARQAMFDYLVATGISEGKIEFSDDELHANYQKDYGITTDDFDTDDYYTWYSEEMDRINCSSLRWVRSRYSVDEGVCLEDDPEYTVDIPVEFLE